MENIVEKHLEHHHEHDEGCKIVINCGGGGHHKHDCCDAEFAEVYSAVGQTLAASPGANMPGQFALLEQTVFATPNIDVSLAATQGKVIVKKSGWYDIA